MCEVVLLLFLPRPSLNDSLCELNTLNTVYKNHTIHELPHKCADGNEMHMHGAVAQLILIH